MTCLFENFQKIEHVKSFDSLQTLFIGVVFAKQEKLKLFFFFCEDFRTPLQIFYCYLVLAI